MTASKMKIIIILIFALRVESYFLKPERKIVDEDERIVENEEFADIPDEEIEDEIENPMAWAQDISDLPETLDYRDYGIMHKIIRQGSCNSCGWIAGTQTLEARVAFVSENYIPYSIQNFMNCPGDVCSAAQPFRVNSMANRFGFIVPQSEIAYTKNKCKKTGNCYKKCGHKNPKEYTNALDDQFVIVVGTGAVYTENAVLHALQDGPISTCFGTLKLEKGERCSKGCGHANTIIGYNKTDETLLLQENYSKNWGMFGNGTWVTKKGSICSKSIADKGRFPVVLYDYDRANAFFTKLENGVRESDLKFVDDLEHSVTNENKKNWGTAKNKCAFIGKICKGVVAISSGKFELVSSFEGETPGDTPAFKKTQMVIYLRNEKYGKYLGIKADVRDLRLVSVDKEDAAPFFTSYSRFISYDFPNFHLVKNKLEKIVGGVRDIDPGDVWKLNDCNLYNAKSGYSFDLLKNETVRLNPTAKKKKHRVKTSVSWTIAGNPFNKTSTKQRFDVSLSGKWTLISQYLGLSLGRYQQKDIFSSNKKVNTLYFRWNARQIINNSGGKAWDPYVKRSTTGFNFKDEDKWFTPTDCTISRMVSWGGADHLAIEEGEVVMSGNMDDDASKWTFEYADL